VQLNGGLNLWDGKLGMSGAFGVQHDNLSQLQSATSQRFISSFNLTYSPIKQLSLSGSYSNFSSSSQPNQLIVDDSVKYAQVTANVSVNATYSFGEADYKHSVNGTYSNQSANTLNTTFTQVEQSLTQLHNASLGYRIGYTPADWSNALTLSFNTFAVDSTTNTSWGANVSTSKSFFKKKLKSTLSYAYLQSWSEQGGRQANIVRLTLGYGYHQHSFSLSGSGNFSRSHNTQSGTKNTQEWMSSLTYSYSFSAVPWKRGKK
jgi:hypothetical protein